MCDSVANRAERAATERERRRSIAAIADVLTDAGALMEAGLLPASGGEAAAAMLAELLRYRVAAASPVKPAVDRRRKRRCAAWAAGCCSRGSSCWFAHD